MSTLAQHLVILPILVPLLAGAMLLVIDEPRHSAEGFLQHGGNAAAAHGGGGAGGAGRRVR